MPGIFNSGVYVGMPRFSDVLHDFVSNLVESVPNRCRPAKFLRNVLIACCFIASHVVNLAVLGTIERRFIIAYLNSLVSLPSTMLFDFNRTNFFC